MAYLDPEDGSLLGRQRASVRAMQPISTLERRTIELSLRDARSSIDEPTRMRRALARLLSPPRQTRLADPRLEALRRFAVLYRLHGSAMRTEEVDRLLTAGFAATQAVAFERQIDSLLDRGRRTRQAGMRLSAALLVVSAAGALLAALAALLDDLLISGVIDGVILVSAAPLMSGRRINQAHR